MLYIYILYICICIMYKTENVIITLNTGHTLYTKMLAQMG